VVRYRHSDNDIRRVYSEIVIYDLIIFKIRSSAIIIYVHVAVLNLVYIFDNQSVIYYHNIHEWSTDKINDTNDVN
jgi:hypothetical protein